MAASGVVLMTDHGSAEGSRALLERAVEIVTGVPPSAVDARHFLSGAGGTTTTDRDGFHLDVPGSGFGATPATLVVYEIPPADRVRLAPFLRRLPRALRWGADPRAWARASDKRRTVATFRRHGIAHMETVALHRPDEGRAVAAFERLGRDVWARPAVGAGGDDVFHLTTPRQVRTAVGYYADTGQAWLMSRDASNVDSRGRRHQFRVVVLHDRVLRVCEHVQDDPDAPCNEAKGAVSTVLPVGDLPPAYRRLAVAATRSLGLPYGGVDLAVEGGGVVFEVNVHPVLDVPGGLESVALPLAEAWCRARRPVRALDAGRS